MVKARRLAAAGLLAVVLAGPVRGEAPQDRPLNSQAVNFQAPDYLKLDYHVYAGGFHALSLETRVSLGPEAYAVKFKARSDGILDSLLAFTLDAEAIGQAAAAGLTPVAFRTANRWRSSGERLVEMTYDGDGLPQTRIEPPADADNRDPVPDALRRGTMDPITAMLSLVHGLARDGRCAGRVPVFDGRRRFDLAARDLGEQDLVPSGVASFAGLVRRCRVTFEPVTGFWRDERWEQPKTSEIEVFLAAVVPGGPPVPVRLEAENAFGAVRIHLVSAGPAE